MLKLMGIISIVQSVKLSEGYLNMAAFKTPVSLLIKRQTFDILTTFLRHHTQEGYTLTNVRFYYATL